MDDGRADGEEGFDEDPGLVHIKICYSKKSMMFFLVVNAGFSDSHNPAYHFRMLCTFLFLFDIFGCSIGGTHHIQVGLCRRCSQRCRCCLYPVQVRHAVFA